MALMQTGADMNRGMVQSLHQLEKTEKTHSPLASSCSPPCHRPIRLVVLLPSLMSPTAIVTAGEGSGTHACIQREGAWMT